MKDRDIDTHLKQYLSGDQPREAFKQQALRDSTAEFVRLRRRRSAWRRAEFAAAAVLIAGIAFIGGRLSVPRKLPRSLDIAPRVTAVPGTPRGESEGVTVPSDLVAWLDAAHLFRRLGMEERMARAVEHAGKLLPYDAMATSNMTGQTLAANDGDEVFENKNKHLILADILYLHESVESLSGIMAQSYGEAMK